MKIFIVIASILFLVGACCSAVVMERYGRLDLVRRAPFAQHPLAIRFKMFSHPVLVPIFLILVTCHGLLSVVTLGMHALGLMRSIARANRELEQYAATYWGGAPRGGNAVERQRAGSHTQTKADDDDCSPEEALASDASTLAGRALQQAGLVPFRDVPYVGIVDNAERMRYCPFMLYLSCMEIAERGFKDARMVAKMAVGEMVTRLDREVEHGNVSAMLAQQACRRAFAGLNANGAAA